MQWISFACLGQILSLYLAADQGRVMQEQMTGGPMPTDPGKAFEVRMILIPKILYPYCLFGDHLVDMKSVVNAVGACGTPFSGIEPGD